MVEPVTCGLRDRTAAMAIAALPMIGIGGKRLAVGNTGETAAAMAIAALPKARMRG